MSDEVDPEELAEWRRSRRRCQLCWNLASCCSCSRTRLSHVDVIDVAEHVDRLAIEVSAVER